MKHKRNGTELSARWLLALPAATYLFSYVYLALYHGTGWLFGTVIHESGTLTLTETIFYASHFLGHLPSLTVVALLFAGAVRCIVGARNIPVRGMLTSPLVLVGFVGLSALISFAYFGDQNTWEYLTQARQSELWLEEGGSWLLHLPTTMLLFAALPVFVAAAAKIYGRPVRMQRAGLPFIGLAALLTAVVTIFRCSDVVESIRNVWTEPRYLAHSVRELATYPLTFFPLPLYFVFRGRNSEAIGEKRWTWGVLAGLSVLTLAGIGWQVGVSLAAGIDGLAQHPAFAVGGRLTIPYLLAAHYFEHVLDTIFFTLLCLWLLQWRVRP